MQQNKKGAVALLFWLLMILLLGRLERKRDGFTNQIKWNWRIKTLKAMVTAITANWSQITTNSSSSRMEKAETDTGRTDRKWQRPGAVKTALTKTLHSSCQRETYRQRKRRVNKRKHCRVKQELRAVRAAESNSTQKHLPAASALAAVPLCALQERCLKSAKHQPEIVYQRQKAELSA